MSSKRAIDVLFSALVLLISAPLFGLLSVLVLWDSGFPVFFRQERMGKNFKPFWILKFRSMRVSQGGPSVTVGGDSRVTRIGKLLRRTKLDELPQFWNVFRGDMSLVGPRPEVPEYVALQPERYRRVLSVRPGITDPASLCFKNEEMLLAASEDPLRYYADVILPAKLDMAEDYIRTRSLRADLKVLFETALLAVPGGHR
jgi:lipopolysaccharide/colanic/teichoic acid biosynthesis glycosyltransferase